MSDRDEWFEHDEFWRVWEPYIFDAPRLEAAAAEIEQLTRLLDVNPPKRVLDLCCGPARHAIELARRGFIVTGVDRAAALLEQGRARAAAAGVAVQLRQCDARRLAAAGEFDFVLNLYSSFGYNRDRSGDLLIARRACAALQPGGKFVIEGVSKEITARDFRERDWYRHSDGALTLHERRITGGWELQESCWTLLRGGSVISQQHISQRLYSGVEMRDLMIEAGFSEVRLYGGFDGAPFDNRALRLVAIGLKASCAPD